MRVGVPHDLVQAARHSGVRDRRLLEAIETVPRAAFVPEDLKARAYDDLPLPIGSGQVTTQPSLVAQMVAALALTDEQTVLEVGTGYGWQTALLARLARKVWSVERFERFSETARRSLAAQGIANAEVVVGDGSGGLPEHAPYDAIIVSAAFPAVPDPLVEQLREGGRLVQPVGWGGDEDVVLFERRAQKLEARQRLTLAHFVRLVGAHGFGERS